MCVRTLDAEEQGGDEGTNNRDLNSESEADELLSAPVPRRSRGDARNNEPRRTHAFRQQSVVQSTHRR